MKIVTVCLTDTELAQAQKLIESEIFDFPDLPRPTVTQLVSMAVKQGLNEMIALLDLLEEGRE